MIDSALIPQSIAPFVEAIEMSDSALLETLFKNERARTEFRRVIRQFIGFGEDFRSHLMKMGLSLVIPAESGDDVANAMLLLPFYLSEAALQRIAATFKDN